MASLSYNSFILVMTLFIFLTIKDSIAHSDDQAKRNFVVHEAENGFSMAPRSCLSVEKQVLDVVPAAAEFSNARVGGRKMMTERKNMKQVEATEEADSKNSSGASAATHSVGNLKYHKGQGILPNKLSDTSNSHSVKSNTRSFMVLNADYHMARPHPPKNN